MDFSESGVGAREGNVVVGSFFKFSLIGSNRYQCSTCGLIHNSVDIAMDCCRYECEVCGAKWMSNEEAENCNGDSNLEILLHNTLMVL